MNFTPVLPLNETVLKSTRSKCPHCHILLPSQVVKIPVGNDVEKVVLRRTCPEHGHQETCISSDARFYFLAKGNPANSDSSCGCGTACSSSNKGANGYLGRNAVNPSDVVEQLSTCLALIEIVDSCNLSCPTCFAASPLGIGAKVKYHSFDDLTKRMQGILDRKGKIEIIQFSGGEPTIHPQFFELVEWVIANPGIDVLLINTNGVRFATDSAFVARMGEIMKTPDAPRKIQLYLQFDGPQLEGQRELRAADLRNIRIEAIQKCASIKLPITLAMTVTTQNSNHLWETVMFALPYENIRGISFQPMFSAGRVPARTDSDAQPINTADIILGLNTQSEGKMSLKDFTSLPCGDPNCAIIGWLFRVGGKYHSPEKFGVSVAELQKGLPDRINYDLEDLKKCGCENTVLGNLMRQMEDPIAKTLRIFIKPFMDSSTWDADRTDRCCTHVIDKEGKLRSFCEYYNLPA